jgi:hypothetical protein
VRRRHAARRQCAALDPPVSLRHIIKHLLRQTAARTLEAVVAAIGKLLGTYTAQECANYFANAGYAQT